LIKKLKKLKLNYDNNYNSNKALLLAITCALVTTVTNAQTNVNKQEQNQQRINALLNKVNALEAPAVNKITYDSLLNINQQQQLLLNEKDVIIEKLKAQLAQKPTAFQAPTAITTENEQYVHSQYIIVGAYNTKEDACKYKAQHNYAQYQIIQSKSKRWYFIAIPKPATNNNLLALKTVRAITEKKAWIYK
jgi:hypothetical protein